MDEFEEFYKLIERLQKFPRIEQRDLKLDHFVELRKHFRRMKILFPALHKLFQDELKTIDRFPESNYKEGLNKFSKDLAKKLAELEQWINNALHLTEETLKIRMMPQLIQHKVKLMEIIRSITEIITESQRDAFELVKLEQAWKKTLKKEKMRPVSKIQVVGKLSNGWRLSDIQGVVIDLGGKIVNNRGDHPYKIIFPRKRPIPLASSTPPFMLVREVSHETNVDKRIIVASFSKGELVA